MRWVLSIGTVLLLAAGGTPARADEAFDKLKKEFGDAQDKWYNAYEKLADKDHPEKGVDESKLPPRPEIEFRPKFKKYADEHAGKPEAIPALVWLASNADSGDGPKADPSGAAAVDELIKKHAAQPEIGKELASLRYTVHTIGRAKLEELFDKIVATNPDKETKGRAEYNLAILAYGGNGEGKVDKEDTQKALKLFRKVEKENADKPVGKSAKSYIFEMENLQIGMIAPEIVGKDVDGKEIKLSSFRGQVVVLDFWGFW